MRGHKRGLGHGALANAAAMHKGLMCQVHQVVDHQAVIAVDGDQLAVTGPGRVVVPVEVGHQRRVGLGRVAGPDPDEPVLLNHRVAAHAGRGVEGFLARHVGAAALRVVSQPVVAAHHFIAFQPPHRQRQQSVPASVFEHCHLAIGLAEHDQFLVANGAWQQRGFDLYVISGGVPGVERETGFFRIHGYRMYTVQAIFASKLYKLCKN